MIPYYTGSIFETIPKGVIPLSTLLNKIQNPKPEVKNLVDRIQRSENEEKAKLKTQLPFFTPAINCEKRCYSAINHFTGLMPFDFDKLGKSDAEALKKELISYPYVIATWLSSSGEGVRGLVSIPVCVDTEEYKKRFKALQEAWGIYIGFDPAPQNCVLPLFYSYDFNLIINHNYKQFRDVLEIKEMPKSEKIVLYGIDPNEKAIYTIAKKKIDTITNAGHYTLRAVSYAVGGYVAQGYVSQNKAIEIIENLIDNNNYLKIKASTYKRTAKEMIIAGQKQPLII